jgi:hypothetical protein
LNGFIEIAEENLFHEAFAAVGGKYLVSAMVELIDEPVQGINRDLSVSQYNAEEVRLLEDPGLVRVVLQVRLNLPLQLRKRQTRLDVKGCVLKLSEKMIPDALKSSPQRRGLSDTCRHFH